MSVVQTKNSTDGMILEFSTKQTASIFKFVDTIFTNLDIVDINSQDSVKNKLQEALDYILRSSLADEAPSNLPIIYSGQSLTASATKISVKAFNSSTTSSFLSPSGSEFVIIVNRQDRKRENSEVRCVDQTVFASHHDHGGQAVLQH